MNLDDQFPPNPDMAHNEGYVYQRTRFYINTPGQPTGDKPTAKVDTSEAAVRRKKALDAYEDRMLRDLYAADELFD